MALSRYAVTDAYILEELRREYQRSDAKARIRLLEQLYEGDHVPPYDIAVLAVEDEHLEVRQWIARNGKQLDYRKLGPMGERSEVKEAAIGILESTSNLNSDESVLNLADRLKNDPDPFIRASLRENPKVFTEWAGGRWKDFFKEANHLERLALVRNPEVECGVFSSEPSLIEKIFDPEDKDLGIDLEQRRELVFAFLTNRKALDKNWANADMQEGSAAGAPAYDGLSWYVADTFLKKLWELASKWPKDSGVPWVVYRYVPALDETRAQMYKQCDEPSLRQVILESCDQSDTDTIRLGMMDSDQACRFNACTKIRHIGEKDLEALLRGEDIQGALWGLAANRSLSIDELEKVGQRLNELKNDSGVEWAQRTIEEVRKKTEKTRSPKEPDELFNDDGREGNFLEDKIDFIGKQLVSFEQQISGGVKSIRKTVTILVVIWLGWPLLVWLFK